MKLLQQVVLSRQRLHHGIGVHVTAGAYSRLGYVFFPLVGSGADNHQESPDILSEDFGNLRDAEGASAPCTGLRQSKRDQYHLIIEHFRFVPPKIERRGDGGQALLFEAYVCICVVFK